MSITGPGVYVFNAINTTPAVVLAANVGRQSVVFHNPGTIDIFVAPTTTVTDAVLTPSTGALGGCFRLFANGGTLTIAAPACQLAWQAFSASSSGLPLTVADTDR